MSKNLFSTAATIAPAPAKNGKKGKVEIKVKGLKTYAVLDAAEKAIKGLKETERGNIDAQIHDFFVTKGVALGAQPENPRGIEDDASASLELKKRSTRSPLDATEVALLSENDIPVGEVEDKPETFIINPEYLQDAALMKRVGEALGKIKGIPMDFILKQEAKKSVVINDDSLPALFKKDEATIRQLIGVVAVTAIKPSVASDTLKDTLKAVAEQL